MTSWTLDISKLQYYSTIGSLTVWGDPEAGDEIVLPNGFSYILPAPALQTSIREYTAREYTATTWRGLTTENHLGSLLTSDGPLINDYQTVTRTSDTGGFIYQEIPLSREEFLEGTTDNVVYGPGIVEQFTSGYTHVVQPDSLSEVEEYMREIRELGLLR
jgi:hypothetical protein